MVPRDRCITRLANVIFDEILDLTADVSFKILDLTAEVSFNLLRKNV